MTLADKLKQAGFGSSEGIEKSLIEAYQHKLYDNGIAVLPVSYIHFLEKINGVQTDSLSLFGITDEKSNTVADIYSRNSIAGIPKQKDRVFLGDNFCEYLCYSWYNKCYQIIDKESGEIVKQFSVFETAMLFFLREYLHK